MNIFLYSGIAIIVLGFFGWVGFGYFSVWKLEEPAYQVVEERDGYEIRQYETYVIAKTQVQGSYDSALNQGFSQIADYIFGNNTSKTRIEGNLASGERASEKIAMTIPVAQTESGTPDIYTVYFVMPSVYTIDTLPKPNNDKVILEEVAGYTAAVKRFSWGSNEERVKKQREDLLQQLKDDNITAVGEPTSAFYNPPATPPFMRRNEILVPIQ